MSFFRNGSRGVRVHLRGALDQSLKKNARYFSLHVKMGWRLLKVRRPHNQPILRRDRITINGRLSTIDVALPLDAECPQHSRYG